MLPIYLGLYLFLLAVLWWFFFVARHHAMRFKRYSTTIEPVSNFMLLFLLATSVFGFFLIFTLWDLSNVTKIDSQKPTIENYY
jgi:hypothetical protein